MKTGALPSMLSWSAVVCAVVWFVALQTGCTVYGGQKQHGWKGATGGESLERQFWADVKARKFSDLEKHMAVSWVFLSASGPLDRAATLERLQRMQINDYLLGDFKVTPNGHDMVVTYTANFSTTDQGQPLSAAKRMLTVWQKAEKGWIAVAHSEVP